MNKTRVKNLTILAMFCAIEILLFMIPFLGFIPIGPLKATTLHIPVIIAGIVLGKKDGSIVGATFATLSMISNTISPTMTSFVFSPFISGSLLSLFICYVPRVMIGYVSGLLYEKLKLKNESMRITISSFFGALTNTFLVLGGIYFLFGNTYAISIGMNINDILPYFLSIIFTQGLLEAIVGSIITLGVSKALMKLL